MSVSPELLEILCCPESHQPLRELSDAEVEQVNSRIKAKELKSIAGEIVVEKVDSGLLREDSSVLYPIRSGIPVLLTEEGIAVGDELKFS